MKVRVESRNGVLVVGVCGRVDSVNAREFETELRDVLGKGAAGVVLDCTELDYVSSAGLRVLLRITRDLDRKRIPFTVCSLSPMISEIFQISGFDRIIPVADSRADALASLPR